MVPDVTAALGALARHVLSRASSATVIALTGSAGKTTTKDMLRHVLSQHGPTVASPGSFNTEIGLPLTVLQADETTRYLVLEMGARHIGDIRRLTILTPPQIGIVLNIGSAHIGEFGSRDAIAQAKAELVEALPDASSGGIAILNADDPLVAAMTARTTALTISYGTGQAHVRATSIKICDGRASFTLHTPAGSAPVNLRLLGAHQVHNALAAAATAHSAGMDTTQIAAALTTAEPSPGRLQILELPGNITIINDAFNANPESMAAGLRSFASFSTNRRRSPSSARCANSAQPRRPPTTPSASSSPSSASTCSSPSATATPTTSPAPPVPPRHPRSPRPQTHPKPHAGYPTCSSPTTSSSSKPHAQWAWNTSRPPSLAHRARPCKPQGMPGMRTPCPQTRTRGRILGSCRRGVARTTRTHSA